MKPTSTMFDGGHGQLFGAQANALSLAWERAARDECQHAAHGARAPARRWPRAAALLRAAVLVQVLTWPLAPVTGDAEAAPTADPR